MKTILNLFTVIFFSVIMALTGAAYGLDPLAVGGTSFALSFISRPAGILSMAIQVEIWQEYIVGNLFKDNQFLTYAYSGDQYVMAGKVVHIPNAGAKATVVRNRSSLPAAVTQRTDVDVTYSLDEFTSDPILLTNAEQVELSYDKVDNVLGEHESAVSETLADWMLYKWAPTATAQILRTTGATTYTAHAPSATGTRKGLIMADVRAARKVMSKNGVSKDNRFAIVDADMHEQLIADMAPSTYRDFISGHDPKTGAIGKLYSFVFFEREYVMTYDNAAPPVPKEPGATGATTDNAAALFWQKDTVERAIGEVKFFERLDDPTYYGDIYSILVRGGGRKRRNDQKGVIAIVQAAGE